jgi:putative transposase
LDERIELVDRHREEHGLNACLEALSVSKGTWHYRMRDGSKREERRRRDEALKLPVIEIIRKNPGYGYRRIDPDLREATGEPVNHKRLRRLLNEWDLAVPRTVARPRPSEVRRILNQARGHLNLVSGTQPGPLEVLSTDFTELRYAGGSRKAWLMALVDVNSAWVPAWAVGPSANRELALACWRDVRAAYARLGVELAVTVHHDQDTVYTSYDWLEALLIESGVRVSYSERGAMDNPWIESFWARFKQENRSLLLEARSVDELQAVIDRQMRYYNRERRHSGVDNQPPLAYLKSEGFNPRQRCRNQL